MAKDLAIILNNGSVNSAVATAMAVQKYRPILIHCDFSPPGNGTPARSKNAYDQQVAFFKPYREHTLSMPFLAPFVTTPGGGGAQSADPRHVTPVGPAMVDLLPLVASAVRFAVHYQATAVYLGTCVGPNTEELAQATEYVQVWNDLIQVPCGQTELTVETPLLELEPWQVVDVGFQTGAPLERTWSCFEQAGEPCWACRGCRARDAAFQQAAKADPLRVVKKV